MNISTVLTTWHTSLLLFKPDTIRLFLLASLNTWIRSIKILGRQLWWFFVFIAPLCIINPEIKYYLGLQSTLLFSLVVGMLDGFIQIFLLYLLIVTVRPSLEIKNLSYYWHYCRAVWFINFIGIFSVSLFLLEYYILPSKNLIIPAIFVGDYKMLLFSLFFFDTDLSLKGLFTAYKRFFYACIYFFPTLAFLITSFATLTYLFAKTFAYVSSMIEPFLHISALIFFLLFQTIIFHLFLLLGFSVIATYYTKVKHEHFNLLFN